MLPVIKPNNLSYSDVNDDFKILQGPKGGNKKYREYIQKNGVAIMKYNTQSYMNEIDYKRIGGVVPELTITSPFMVSNIQDKSVPPFGSRPSDLKDAYLANLRTQTRKVQPEIKIGDYE